MYGVTTDINCIVIATIMAGYLNYYLLILSLFIHGFLDTVFKYFSYGFQNSFQCCIQYFKPIKSSPYKINPVDSPEYLVIHTLLNHITHLVQVMCKFSRLTIVYPNI